MTASKSARSRSRYGIARRTSANRSSSANSSQADSRDNLLRQNIERSFRNLQTVELAAADRAHQRRTLDQFIASGREQAAFRQRADPVPRAADPLQRHGDRARRTDLADQIHGADIDAQFERRGRHHRPQFAVLQALLGLEPQRARKAAVMRQNCILAQPLGQLVGHALGQPARVDEHQRGPVLLRQRGDAVVDLVPHFHAGDGAQLIARNFHRQIHGAPMPDLNDMRAVAQESGDVFDGADGRRQPDFL